MKDGVKARYTLEFKRDAVRLVRGGEKVSAIARTLGYISPMAFEKNRLANQQKQAA